MQFGFSVNGYGVGDLVDADERSSATPRSTGWLREYERLRSRDLRRQHDRPESLRDAARIELGLRAFLEDGGFGASPTPSRTCTGWRSCRASRRNG